MNKNTSEKFEDATPNPEYLIKSIAEQGYSLETALADLMDNSISEKASNIEVLIDIEKEPFILYLADNGNGMNEHELKAAMQFPSSSPEQSREKNDLGRFGLGMKTASFSQTRRFTVISKKSDETKYSARTWDVELLKSKEWKLLVNSEPEIEEMLSSYKKLSESYFNSFDNFEPNTIIVWNGLYKFEKYIENTNRQDALKKEITEVTSEHLSLVFHRFLEPSKSTLKIRINNQILEAFNPFPTEEKDFRSIEYKQRIFGDDSIKIEGYVLPSRSMDESKNSLSKWTTKYRSLMDMEGVYIYRADRIILFGGWNGLIKKAPRLQLARLRVDIGNSADHLLHLNVAKSQVIIPHDLKQAFENYIDELKVEAEREFFNRGIRKFPETRKGNKVSLFERKASNNGSILELNKEFPLVSSLLNNASLGDRAKIYTLIKMINTTINEIRKTHEDKNFVGLVEEDGVSVSDLLISITELKNSGLTNDFIKREILPHMGYRLDSLPVELFEALK